MSKQKSVPARATGSATIGIIILVAMLLAFLITYAVAVQYTETVGDNDFSRVQTWTGYLISAAALFAIGRHWMRLTGQMGVVGLILGGWVWLSVYSRTNMDRANVEAAVTLLAFFGGSVLLPRHQGVRVALLHRDHWLAVLQALWLGIRVSLPLAIMTAGYLMMTNPSLAWQDPVQAITWAVGPAIVGEVVFRFFVLNLCLSLLANMPVRTPLVAGIFILAVAPYSLVEVAELWTSDPTQAISLAILYSILYGLPAAYLQWRKTLEAAIGFHWIIDSLRAWAGVLF
jgi:hypothetical protein